MQIYVHSVYARKGIQIQVLCMHLSIACWMASASRSWTAVSNGSTGDLRQATRDSELIYFADGVALGLFFSQILYSDRDSACWFASICYCHEFFSTGGPICRGCLGRCFDERARLLCAVKLSDWQVLETFRNRFHVEQPRLAAPYCYAQTIDVFDFSIPVLVLLFAPLPCFDPDAIVRIECTSGRQKREVLPHDMPGDVVCLRLLQAVSSVKTCEDGVLSRRKVLWAMGSSGHAPYGWNSWARKLQRSQELQIQSQCRHDIFLDLLLIICLHGFMSEVCHGVLECSPTDGRKVLDRGHTTASKPPLECQGHILAGSRWDRMQQEKLNGGKTHTSLEIVKS